MGCHRVLSGLVLVLCGCASVQSTPLSAARRIEGVTYFMPKQDLLVTITVKDGGKSHDASIALTQAYPDLSKGYLLQHVANGISKSTSAVQVGTNGLLTTTETSIVSGVTEVAKSLGQIAGTVSAVPGRQILMQEPTPASDNCASGTHVFRIDLQATGKFVVCDDTIEVTRLIARADTAPALGPAEANGLFYRQAEPYSVEVRGGGRVHAAGIVLSPSNAPVRYLPVRRSFAAGNETKVAFTDGMPTSVKQDIDGEFVAIVKLPAVVASSYFKAIGSLFDSFKTRDTNEAEVLAGEIKLDLAKRKYEACLAAIRSGDTATQASLACNE